MVHITVSRLGLLVGPVCELVHSSNISGSVYKSPENELTKAKLVLCIFA